MAEHTAYIFIWHSELTSSVTDIWISQFSSQIPEGSLLTWQSPFLSSDHFSTLDCEFKKKNWSFSNILSRKTNSEWISDTHGARLTISSEAWQERFASHRGDKGLRSRIQHKELSEFNEKVNPQKTEEWFQLTLHQIMKYCSTNNDLQIDKTVWIYFQYILLGQIKPVGAHLAEILEKSES